MVDHLRMVIHLNETQIRTLEQVRAVLDGTQALVFAPATDAGARCEWIASVLKRFRYGHLKRGDRGLLLRYLRRFGGFSRAHLTRLVLRWLDGSNLVSPKRKAPPNAFARRYTEADLDALAEVEREYGRLSGPATVAVLRRMYQLYDDERFVRLQQLSSSHLYNLRRSASYRARHTVRTKTRSDPKGAAIAMRRAPTPENRPGFIRIDSVHQGNFRSDRGLYHINAVDCVTQWEVVASVQTLAREHMLPVLRDMIDQFPFQILGFHSDGGTEYINYEVADMLEKERIEFTRSRPRHCNDNALAESKNGNVVRRQFGYSHVPASYAEQFNAFCSGHLNPFLNLHRPCLFGTEVPDPRKKGRTRRVHRHKDVMTPLDKLLTLPDAGSFLREGITVDSLQQQARSQTDIEAARQVREAREALMDPIAVEVRARYGDVWSYARESAA
ncbi:transposase family protein [Paraburkholderia sp. 31.1]|uniref:integrase catalytic domain-containing protein n=1 Tax=Paraburkholderia sp. 31.1 TaxID=2615205 RepID=UPI001655DD82|nr:DDE-type integrase/transposase/recombinase [Paraburkholderia sp. 31.1]MBC8720616.1 transposase family protein [Paraburkholderia sp. 31.1]